MTILCIVCEYLQLLLRFQEVVLSTFLNSHHPRPHSYFVKKKLKSRTLK